MLNEQQLEERIATILLELSVPKNSQGFKYMAQAIKNEYEAINDPQRPKVKIYAKLTEQFGRNSSLVYKYLRSAVDKMYQKKDCNGVRKYFGENSIFQICNPRMRRVIKELAWYIMKEEEI